LVNIVFLIAKKKRFRIGLNRYSGVPKRGSVLKYEVKPANIKRNNLVNIVFLIAKKKNDLENFSKKRWIHLKL
jgi:hypothetical protein